ncbi:MAG: ABC-2 family transporter protein [Anaerolineae bacterium]|nr:ABC-2 family transporter protein [Anaerolineae bacterium]
MHYLKIFSTLVKINVEQELAYRADTVINISQLIIWTAWDLLALSIIFTNTASLGGWGAGELVALLGVFRLVNALMAALIWPNTERFNTAMRDGTLDYTLLLPAPALLLVSFTRIAIWRVVDFVIAITLIVIGVTMSAGGLTVAGVLSFALLLSSGMVIFYSLWIAMLAFTFWFIKFDNNVTILQALLEAGRYPATVYPPWLRMIVTFIVPIALATTVPVQALRGELQWWQVLMFLGVAVVVVAVSLRIWRAGLRKYSGASA